MLGYEDISTAGNIKVLLSQSTAQSQHADSKSKYCSLLKDMQSTSKNKDLCVILFKGLLCNIIRIF